MYLIHRNDDLQKLLFDLIDIGYTPGILYETGRIAKLIIEYNKTTFIIKTQQLTTKSIERHIHVDSELVYNNMSVAMTKFNKRMLKLTHKSYYNKQDVDILDEYRTIANSGLFAKCPKEALSEIDISKAYTAALSKITQIPVFNEFDIFKPYEQQEIKDYNLYIVKVESLSLFFNKTYNLAYGIFLHNMKDVDILAYKEPSSLKSVCYKDAVNELYDLT